MKKLSELQEKSERQFNELRNKTNNQREKFPKEIQTLKSNQTEILELKTSINRMKNTLESIRNRVDHTEEGTSELKNRNLEMIQTEEERKLRFPQNEEILQEYSNSFRRSNSRVMGIHPRRRREGKESDYLKK